MSKARSHKWYGWVPDLPDKRDFRFQVAEPTAIPPAVNLEAQCSPVVNQGDLGSCTANAIAGAIEFDQLKQRQTLDPASRLFIYYNERVIEGSVREDSGAMIRDGIKSINVDGACSEKLWPYLVSKFARKPSKICYSAAKRHQALKYQRVTQSIVGIKQVLASGFPIVFGFSVYDSFESDEVASSGIVPMPDFAQEGLLGGHAVLCVGYDDATRRYRVRNSWGAAWGQKGYCEMPYEYLADHDLASDFWVVQLIE